MAPSMVHIAQAIRGLFAVHDWENYGHHYSRTLSSWQSRFERNWGAIGALGFDERFRRMWNFYLMCSKVSFDLEDLFLWQIVMAKKGSRDQVYPRVNLYSQQSDQIFPAKKQLNNPTAATLWTPHFGSASGR